MAGLIDTNVLLHAANASSPEHERARAFLLTAGRSPGPWCVTEGILYEFLRVATHARAFDRPLAARDAWAFLRSVIAAPSVSVLVATPAHWEWLDREIASMARVAGNLFFDLRTVVLMREHGIRRVYTADDDFRKFRGIEVVNPLD